jgi:hypothetical protein
MSATVVQSDTSQLAVLGRYAVPEEGRVLVGRRIEGEVYVYDYPVDGKGRRYFVERGFESKAELPDLAEEIRAEREQVANYVLDLSLSGLDCEEGRAIQLALVKLGQSGATGVLEVGKWLCTREPLSEYPTLTRCRSDDGHQLNVLGTAPHAHLTPTEQAQARSTSGSGASQRQAPKPVFFETPSGNITCGLSRRGVTCEIFRKSYTPYIPKPPSCPLDYGHGSPSGPTGRRSSTAMETRCAASPPERLCPTATKSDAGGSAASARKPD